MIAVLLLLTTLPSSAAPLRIAPAALKAPLSPSAAPSAALFKPSGVDAAHRALVKADLADKGVAVPAVIAHRGAPWYAPEESLASYALALEMNADYLEGDLHLTKDGVLILNHDDDFSRTTDVAELFPGREKERVSAFTWEEIQRLTVKPMGRPFAPAGLRILRLEELLAIARSDPSRSPGVYLEAKSPEGEPGKSVDIARAAAKLLEDAGWITGAADDGKRVIFQSFEADAVKAFKEAAPSVPATYLHDWHLLASEHRRELERAKESGADIAGPRLLPHQFRSYARAAHRRGLGVHPWGINDLQLKRLTVLKGRTLMRWLLKAGGDGFFTDQPEQAREGADLDALFDGARRRVDALRR